MQSIKVNKILKSACKEVYNIVYLWYTGADPGFSFRGGGAQKITCANAHYEREIRSPFRQRSRARLRALEALGFFYAL